MNRETVTRYGRTFTVTTFDPIEATPRKTRPVEFVKVPIPWIDKLAGQDGVVWIVGMQLLVLDFKSYKRGCKLTNTAVGRLKISRKVKYRVLKRLENLGLISVERAPGKAAVITIQRDRSG
jgi:hypothetical protein